MGVRQVGKYAYSISNPAHEAVTPVILDVALESRVKVRKGFDQSQM